MDHQLFPALSLRPRQFVRFEPKTRSGKSRSLFARERFGLVGVSVKNPAEKREGQSHGKGKRTDGGSSWSGELAEAGKGLFHRAEGELQIRSAPADDAAGADNVTFEVEIDGESTGEKYETLQVRSINDCPFAVANSEETLDDENSSPAMRRSAGCSCLREREPSTPRQGSCRKHSRQNSSAPSRSRRTSMRKHCGRCSPCGRRCKNAGLQYRPPPHARRLRNLPKAACEQSLIVGTQGTAFRARILITHDCFGRLGAAGRRVAELYWSPRCKRRPKATPAAMFPHARARDLKALTMFVSSASCRICRGVEWFSFHVSKRTSSRAPHCAMKFSSSSVSSNCDGERAIVDRANLKRFVFFAGRFAIDLHFEGTFIGTCCVVSGSRSNL